MQCNLQRNLIKVATTTKRAEKDDCSSFFELPWSNIVSDEIWSRQKLTRSFLGIYRSAIININNTWWASTKPGFFGRAPFTLNTFVNFTNVHSEEKKIWVRACVHRAVTCSNQIKQVFQARQVFPTILNRNVRAGKLIDVHRKHINSSRSTSKSKVVLIHFPVCINFCQQNSRSLPLTILLLSNLT